MQRPVVIHETTASEAATPASRSVDEVAKVLKQIGFESIEIPSSWPRESDAERTLRRLTNRHLTAAAVLCGFIHTSDDYAELYAALAAKNLMLINSPAEYVRCHSLAAAYPHIRGLTPESVIVKDIGAVAESAWRLGFPLFIKGAVQSRKDRGWDACVARSIKEAQEIVADLLDAYSYSEGNVLLRKLVPLRHRLKREDGFPIAREFRVLLHEGTPIGMGHYWPEEDSLAELAANEREAIEALAREAAERLRVPFLAVDIAQREDGKWIIIETGDPQTSGYSKLDVKDCFTRLGARMLGHVSA